MAETLKVVTIGAGYFARFHHEAWSRMPRARLAAICDLDRDKAEAAAQEVGVETVYDDPAELLARERPDLVDIATPPASHRDLVALAASEGIDVVCQKAFTRSLDEARETVAIAEGAGVTLAVHENFRFQPWFREIRRLVDERAFGDLYAVSFRLRPGDGQGPRAYLDRQPYFQGMERFLVHETAIHLIDTFRFLCGGCEAVYADLRRLNPAIAGEDAGVILMTPLRRGALALRREPPLRPRGREPPPDHGRAHRGGLGGERSARRPGEPRPPRLRLERGAPT